MKILLAGGGTGGHFYPLIAVAEALQNFAQKEKILDLELFYISDTPYDRRALDDNHITFYALPTGKQRVYFSLENFFDIFRTAFATVRAIFMVYKIFPDIVFSKGGYPSVPVVIAAKFLGIPIVVHESDSVPGRANKLAAKWAKRIAVTFPEASDYFPKEKTAFVGPIVRPEVRTPMREGAVEYLKLRTSLPVVFVLGGSQGAQLINENIINALPQLLDKYQIIHQTGTKNFDEVKIISDLVLKDSPNKQNYYPYPYLNKLALRMCAGVANMIVSRAGSASIGEIASWGIPSIIIPITKSNGNHQRENAFSYARLGACAVIEEANLKPNVLIEEINRILGDKNLQDQMRAGAGKFVFPDAEDKIAKEIMNIALTHENV